MNEILALGFLIGLQHALEADHLMAMAALTRGGGSLAAAARRGVVWGLGHTLTLLAIGGTALLAGRLVPAGMARSLEFGAGLMLLALGAEVLRRIHRDALRARQREADPPQPQARSAATAPSTRSPAHAERFPLRALGVGMVHGMAGSAALVVLTLHTVASPQQGLLYILVFGMGSIAGMGIMGAALGMPLGWSARHAPWSGRRLDALLGCATAALGLWVMYAAGTAA